MDEISQEEADLGLEAEPYSLQFSMLPFPIFCSHIVVPNLREEELPGYGFLCPGKKESGAHCPGTRAISSASVFTGFDLAASCSVPYLGCACEFKIIRIREVGRFSPMEFTEEFLLR